MKKLSEAVQNKRLLITQTSKMNWKYDSYMTKTTNLAANLMNFSIKSLLCPTKYKDWTQC